MDNTYNNLLEELRTKRIIVFGCGQYFREFLQRYPFWTEKIDMILDNSKEQEAYVWKKIRIPIIRPVKLERKDYASHVFVFCADKWKEMRRQLDNIIGKNYSCFHYPFDIDYRKEKELGIYHRIIVPSLEKLREYANIENAVKLAHVNNEAEMTDGLRGGKIHTIPRLAVVLTPKCSMRCKECSNLMWKFTNKNDLLSARIISSLKNITGQFDFLPCVELIGGEPFAAKNMKEVLGFLLEEKKVLSVEITTNATIIPCGEIISQLKNNKVVIHISNYGNVVNQHGFIECMKKNGIKFYVSDSPDKWIAVGGIEKRNRNSGDLIRQYYQCKSGYLCKTLWEDRIYPCARAASLAVLGIMPECPFIDCTEKEKLLEKLYSFYVVPSCGACDYCDVAIEEPVYVEPAVQLER